MDNTTDNTTAGTMGRRGRASVSGTLTAAHLLLVDEALEAYAEQLEFALGFAPSPPGSEFGESRLRAKLVEVERLRELVCDLVLME